MSEVLEVALSDRSYPIHIGTDVLARAGELIGGKRRVVITDSHVAPLYLSPLLQGLGLSAEDAYILPAGEASKNWDNASAVLDWMLGRKLARDAQVVALGGGVVGDLAGFCASIYQRGIAFVQVPTTLLAMVDSSVGGKTGVNHARGKNLIGAFHQPSLVLADLGTLKTLPRRELSAGAAEVIKYGMLGDVAFFQRLADGALAALMALEPTATAEIVRHCCAMKAQIVGLDEREAVAGGPRSLLNLGHTFGHAVEAFTGYQSWLHGEAVGLGLLMAADLSAREGGIDAAALARCRAVIAAAGLPLLPPQGMRPEDFTRLMAGDKKVADGQLRLVLLKSLGEAVLTAGFNPTHLQDCLAQFCAAAAP